MDMRRRVPDWAGLSTWVRERDGSAPCCWGCSYVVFASVLFAVASDHWTASTEVHCHSQPWLLPTRRCISKSHRVHGVRPLPARWVNERIVSWVCVHLRPHVCVCVCVCVWERERESKGLLVLNHCWVLCWELSWLLCLPRSSTASGQTAVACFRLTPSCSLCSSQIWIIMDLNRREA